MFKKILFLTLLSVLFFSCNTSSKKVDLSELSVYEYIGNSNFSFDSIKNNVWIKATNNIVSKIYQKEPLWLKIVVRKKTVNSTSNWIFTAGRPLIDSITFYKPKKHFWEKELYGFMIPRSKRIVEHHKNVIPITLKDTLQHTYYLKIKNRAALELPFSIEPEKKFWVKSHSNISFMGILYGGIIAMLFYNLFLFFSIKHKSYWYYSISVFTALVVQSILKGHFSFYILPEYPNFAFYLFYNLIFVNLFFSIEFCKSLLGIEKNKEKGYYFLLFLQYASIISLISILFLPFTIYGYITLFMVLIYSFGLLYVGIINALAGNKIAKYFNIAWGVYLIGIIINIFKTLEIVPTNSFTINIGHIGSYLEVILLSLILGYRYNLLKEEKETLQLHFTENLQKQVQQKTHQLTTALSQKNELLSEVHHRVKNNLQVIFSLFNLQERRVKNDETKKALEAGKNRVKSMSLLHEHLYKNNSFKQINSKEYLSDLVLYLTNLYKKEIQIQLEIDEVFIPNDFAIPLGLITTEILSNTFKYAFTSDKKNPEIKLKFYQKENNYYLLILDNGIGFDTTKKTNSLGTQLIKGMCNQLNGTISINMTNGTSYAFTFPITK